MEPHGNPYSFSGHKSVTPRIFKKRWSSIWSWKVHHSITRGPCRHFRPQGASALARCGELSMKHCKYKTQTNDASWLLDFFSLSAHFSKPREKVSSRSVDVATSRTTSSSSYKQVHLPHHGPQPSFSPQLEQVLQESWLSDFSLGMIVLSARSGLACRKA